RGRPGNDRRRQHRRRHPRDDHRDRPGNVERRPAARPRARRGADRHRAGAERRRVPGQGSRPAEVRMILPLELEDLSYVVNGRTLVGPVSLRVESGPSTIVLGANGAGKSVLMRLMHGLLEPSAGRIDWTAPERPGAPRKQAMVFQRPVMLRRSAYANVAYALKLAGIQEPQRGVLVR